MDYAYVNLIVFLSPRSNEWSSIVHLILENKSCNYIDLEIKFGGLCRNVKCKLKSRVYLPWWDGPCDYCVTST